MNKLLIGILMLLNSQNIWAINVGNITEIIYSDENMLSIEIKNPVDMARFVSLSVDRISSPLEEGVVLSTETKDEILFTPSHLVLSADSSDFFKIIYNGPKDDKERYYHLNWLDSPVVEDSLSDSNKKSGAATTSALISTILVVAPRVEVFDYQHRGDVIHNKGNSTFRVIASGPCKEVKDNGPEICHERYYLMPGLKVHLQKVDVSQKRTTIGIWHKGNFIKVN